MTKQHASSGRHSTPTSRPAVGRAPMDQDTSAVPQRPTAAELAPPPGAGSGGVENIPDEALPKSKQIEEELNHAGLDIALPGEDQARAGSAGESSDVPPR